MDDLLTQSYCRHEAASTVVPVTIGELLRESAARWPDIVALREIGTDGAAGRSWTYRALLRDAERLGRALASRHAPGARVAIYANNVPEWVLI